VEATNGAVLKYSNFSAPVAQLDRGLATNQPQTHSKSLFLLRLRVPSFPWPAPKLLEDVLSFRDQIPATRGGRGGKFMIARAAIVKYAERIR
jgi:hypothetical protein